MKKLLAVSIIFLFFGMIIFPSSGIQIDNKQIIPTSRGNTLYVGGSGGDNYTTIQSAIDDAVDGDTVFVYDDSSPYNEWDIQINKSINLIGEDKNTTVIDGNSNYNIIIPKSSCIISGFSIINGFYGIYPYLDSSENIIISDNHFVNFVFAICLCFLSGDFDSCIISNSFSEYEVAIYSDVSGIVTISDNIITRTRSCGYFPYGDISCFWGNYMITNNTFCNIMGEYVRGLLLEIVENSIIKGNKFSGYDDCAIWFYDDNYNNIITHNNFIKNSAGIDIRGESHSNKIINNNFIDNKCDAYIRFPSYKYNILDGNYWDKWIGNKIKLPFFQNFPHIIFGFLSFGIDWHPAKEPYDI